ncbi:winged helix-turn-helix transcriptional regulator [Rhodococcus erythropolis]|uniref:winged helix-turn-helix transcriptional regulator n=1 Tax=Rhodococcus erythropolis TaxID=1833 RepID=UPI00366ACE02
MSTEEGKSAIKRSYGQYCGSAWALDVVGNRLSLLIVRELLGGHARYGKLQAGLPGTPPTCWPSA